MTLDLEAIERLCRLATSPRLARNPGRKLDEAAARRGASQELQGMAPEVIPQLLDMVRGLERQVRRAAEMIDLHAKERDEARIERAALDHAVATSRTWQAKAEGLASELQAALAMVADRSALADARLAALERYGEHDGDCPAQEIVPRTGCALGDCTPGACGLDAALEDK